MTSINDDLRGGSMRPLDRGILITIAALVVGILAFGYFVGLPRLDNLNQDDKLIDRGQQATNCIGIRQDLVDKWRAIATAEFVIQAQRSQNGLPILTGRALSAERAIYALVDEKSAIRDQHLDLIAAEDPDAEFVCTALDADLIPPPLTPD